MTDRPQLTSLPEHIAAHAKTPLRTYAAIGAAMYALGIMLLIVALFATTTLCKVEGDSMNNTLFDKEYVLLNKLDREFERGEIVVFYSERRGYDLVKRVIGVAGDEIRFVPGQDGTVLLERRTPADEDFQLVEEDYIKEPMQDSFFDGNHLSLNTTTVVEPNQIYVLGDNRNHSEDSRIFGCVDLSLVKGSMYYGLTKDSPSETLFLLLYGEYFNEN